MERALASFVQADLGCKNAFLSGSRNVGQTTLARALAETGPNDKGSASPLF